jgi:hypothetical protein
MLKKKLFLALVVLLPSYSYSESIAPYYGYTGNAVADQALQWSMGNVLPSPPGLDIQNVIYSYKINKETGDFVSVNVQNENALGTGYIFRQTDDWMPGSLSGTRINKVVGVGSIPREFWGDGSIEVNGPGSVYEANVVYTYRVDPCYDPQFDPNCPGYVQPTPVIYEVDLDSLYDATKDENIDLDRKVALEQNEENLDENERKKEEAEEELKRKYRLEKALSAVDASALFAESQRIQQMNQLANMAATTKGYYAASIPGGTYNDSVVLVDSKLPENRSGLRNGFAQQLLHQQMVESQFKLNNKE